MVLYEALLAYGFVKDHAPQRGAPLVTRAIPSKSSNVVQWLVKVLEIYISLKRPFQVCQAFAGRSGPLKVLIGLLNVFEVV